MKRLIVTADDFGASLEVNEAVERAHRDGILTAASLMVGGAAMDDAVERARRLPSLGVGLHIVLVDERPVLPPDRIPALVDARGDFRTDMVRAAVRIFASPATRRQLTAEVEAQFAAFAATGLPLDHVNAHKHFHLHPTIAATLITVGGVHAMRAVRAPVEPAPILRAVDGTRAASPIEDIWARRVRRRMRDAAIVTPDQVFGLAWSGAMIAPRLHGLLEHLPDGLTEIYVHPATGPYAGSAPGYRYAEELAALTAPLAKQAVARNGIILGRFADFIEGERS
ncbi:hopanoid biosynthesis-associated protein HpnK [Sphingobium estronivorans]|uniref:hopanoid biosynthesis-associated protein HpnK n=1 Tax=Sphingobium estronivorans TaxID=1577690 RepID=UPI00123A4DEB|nr:hopanoid biosynthesis-associated protein HpnK [Sphingobium estronivorans]